MEIGIVWSQCDVELEKLNIPDCMLGFHTVEEACCEGLDVCDADLDLKDYAFLYFLTDLKPRGLVLGSVLTGHHECR